MLLVDVDVVALVLPVADDDGVVVAAPEFMVELPYVLPVEVVAPVVSVLVVEVDP